MANNVIDRPTAAIPGLRGSLARYNPKSDALREQFRALADWWHEATDALSSPSLKVQHRAYQQIIRLKQPVVPFILEDLSENGGYWFYALEQITGMSPMQKDKPTSFALVREAWLKWGSDQGLI